MSKIIPRITGQCFWRGYPVNEFSLCRGERGIFTCITENGAQAHELKMQDDLVFPQNAFSIIKWKNDYEISLRPTCSDVAQAEERFFIGSLSGKIVVFGENTLKVILGDYTFSHYTCVNITSPKVQILNGQSRTIADVRATCEDGEYILMLSLGANDTEVLLEEFGKNILARGNDVIIEKHLRDMRGRVATKTYTWNGAKFQNTSNNFICTNEHIYNRELFGFLLLEDISAGDFSRLNELVTPDVNDIDSLKTFFGKISEVRAPLCPCDISCAGAIYKNSPCNLARVFKFEFENDKICNIIEL